MERGGKSQPRAKRGEETQTGKGGGKEETAVDTDPKTPAMPQIGPDAR